MKKFLPAFFATTLLISAQDQPTGVADEKKETEMAQYVTDINNLPPEQKQQYRELLMRCDQLFKQRRVFECLEALYEIHKIYDGNPSTMNLVGACYVEFRSFDKARLAFEKVMKVQPDNFNVRFNLAEIEFVTHNWEEALNQLTALESESDDDDKNSAMNSLVKFKMLLCMLNTDNQAGAQKILDATTFLDDSPLHYYGNAAMAYYSDNGGEAEVWLARAGRIFRDPSALAPWQDTLIEFGYIKSFYGGDLEVENGPPSTQGE